MGMSYDAPLIVEGDLVKLTGLAGTSNLEGTVGSDTFDRTDLILESHRAIYRKLERRGVDPTKLSNEDRLKSAVAYEVLVRLAMEGVLDPFGDRERSVTFYAKKRDEELDDFVPAVTSGDPPRLKGIPAVANFEPGWDYGPVRGAGPTGQRYWDDIPDSR